MRNKQRLEEISKELIEEIGEDSKREGLLDTPDRMARMFLDVFRGYNPGEKPKITSFNNGADGVTYDQMVTDTGNYYSYCEHHMVPFFGQYWFAYVPNPNGKILGLSKVARIVDYHSAKMQIQERLVQDIVNELWNALCIGEVKPLGMALVMKGEHLCKTMRGAKKKGTMTTSDLRGCFKDQIETRQEFFNLIKL